MANQTLFRVCWVFPWKRFAHERHGVWFVLLGICMKKLCRSGGRPATGQKEDYAAHGCGAWTGLDTIW